MLIQLALLRMYSHVTRGLWGTLGKGTLVADRSQHTLSGCIGLFPLVVFWKQIAGDVHVSSRDSGQSRMGVPWFVGYMPLSEWQLKKSSTGFSGHL